MDIKRKSHSPQMRKDIALKLLINEKHPFVQKQSQSPETRMTRSSVYQKKKIHEHPINSPMVQDLLKQCRFLEELVKKSRHIISEKETVIQKLQQQLKQKDTWCKELQIQSHKLMEERQILIEHITQLENQLNIQEDEDACNNQYYQDSHDGFQHHMTNLNDLRHFLNQIRQSNEDIPVFVDVDNLTYEQLLQLEDTIGYVNRGLTKEQIKTIPKVTFDQCNSDEELCSVCQIEFEQTDKCRVLPCQHIYHSKCIKQWLGKEKHCPICKQELEINPQPQSSWQLEKSYTLEQ